jgi:hypothetical protein
MEYSAHEERQEESALAGPGPVLAEASPTSAVPDLSPSRGSTRPPIDALFRSVAPIRGRLRLGRGG